jgi:hypothetical protein
MRRGVRTGYVPALGLIESGGRDMKQSDRPDATSPGAPFEALSVARRQSAGPRWPLLASAGCEMSLIASGRYDGVLKLRFPLN